MQTYWSQRQISKKKKKKRRQRRSWYKMNPKEKACVQEGKVTSSMNHRVEKRSGFLHWALGLVDDPRCAGR